MMTWLHLGLAAALAGPCPDPAERPTGSELGQTATDGLALLARDDLRGFQVNLEVVQDGLPCVGGPLRTHEAVELHLLHGVQAYRSDGPVAATPYFQAARALNADPITVRRHLVVDKALFEVWTGLPGEPGEEDRARLPVSARGSVYVDGSRALSYPTGRPWLYQYEDAQGHLVETLYVTDGALPKDYPRLRPRLAIIASSTGGSSLLMLGVAVAARAALEVDYFVVQGLSADHSALDHPRRAMRANQVAVVSSLVLGGVAVGATARLIESFRWRRRG